MFDEKNYLNLEAFSYPIEPWNPIRQNFVTIKKMIIYDNQKG